MGTSDEELEWRERVQRAQKETGARLEKSRRPLWEHLLGQLLRTCAQFAFAFALLTALLWLWARSAFPGSVSWP